MSNSIEKALVVKSSDTAVCKIVSRTGSKLYFLVLETLNGVSNTLVFSKNIGKLIPFFIFISNKNK
jgi:hypothetical protein